MLNIAWGGPPHLKKKCGSWPKKPAQKSRIWPPLPLKKTREVAEKNAKKTEFGPPENAKITKEFFLTPREVAEKKLRDVDLPI